MATAPCQPGHAHHHRRTQPWDRGTTGRPNDNAKSHDTVSLTMMRRAQQQCGALNHDAYGPTTMQSIQLHDEAEPPGSAPFFLVFLMCSGAELSSALFYIYSSFIQFHVHPLTSSLSHNVYSISSCTKSLSLIFIKFTLLIT